LAVSAHYAIVIYRRSFDAHERSPANEAFTRSSTPSPMCVQSRDLSYDMLPQGGVPDAA
jgi:hypothetical protein